MIDDLRTWVGVIGGAIGLIGAVYAWLTAGSKTNADEIKALRTGQAELRQAIAELRSDLQNRPKQGAVHELAITVTGLAGEVKAIGQQVSTVERITERIDQFLREQSP